MGNLGGTNKVGNLLEGELQKWGIKSKRGNYSNRESLK